MYTKISVQKINDKLKVYTPYNEHFVSKAHLLRGRWQDKAWWFDEAAIVPLRELLISLWNTTGESPYEACDLLIKNYSDSARLKPVYLFNWMIAKANSAIGNILVGSGVYLMDGTFEVGGDFNNWETVVKNATFEIREFPVPALKLPDVRRAIAEGWCEVLTTRTRKEGGEDIEVHPTRILLMEG
ncbi:hypothetical protein [[Flexibacter] sp. ATCC 35208]|uniref:hypothetical protein n=1 Tax=[Flexibacter] sp. ATCC 35208 TaxID=1936242 RepID=UPI0009CFF64A|nr:hypothetical protein [[Flexibacter] sp. ATCC 35208]OMP80035.1 hypothetical protein BW716_05960 [[Flexibacter] sp. ATCC 35208]